MAFESIHAMLPQGERDVPQGRVQFVTSFEVMWKCFQITGLALVVSLVAVAGPVSNEASFRDQLAPILNQHCSACHSAGSLGGDLSMAGYETVLRGGKHGPAIAPGHAGQSLLIQYLRGEKTPRMPLGGSLPDDLIAKLEKAINEMEPLSEAVLSKDEHAEWLFKPPQKPAVPEVTKPEWVRNPIDAFVLARLERDALSPAPPASRRDLIRRLYFDLIGLPPTPEEVRAFIEDVDPNAYENLVDRLLADTRYGERWARHWLDLVRYAESDGFSIDAERPTAWRYRDYVIRSLNSDKPYDVFIKEQLAGDEMKDKFAPGQTRGDRLVALGFLRMGTWEMAANSKEQLRQDFLNEITRTTASTFLGLTVGCAQCHDHKYDPIPQRDFYRMQAFFAASSGEERWVPFTELEQPAEIRRLYRRYEDAVEGASGEEESRKEDLLRRYIELEGVDRDDEKVKAFLGDLQNPNPVFQDRKHSIYGEEVFDRYIEARRKHQELAELLKRFEPIALSIKEIVPPMVPAVPKTHLLVAGELDVKAEEVEPGFPRAVIGKDEAAKLPFTKYNELESTGRRLGLAEWVASKENPLTARVMINRLWQQHFGQGIIRTPSDFGKNGDRPSHPELLDWLATKFVENGWSIKAMHRLVLTSNTYRQSAEHPEWNLYSRKDANNRLLWRMNWQRLEAESLRDSILAVSGRLNLTQRGPGFLLDVPDDVAEGFINFTWYPSSELEQQRRSIYALQRRSVVMPLMEAFDGANMNETCSRRNTTTVAPQALTLFNSETTYEEARHFAARVIERIGDGREAQIAEAFWLALGRAPTASEMKTGIGLIEGEQPLEGLTRLGVVLFNLNEFLYME